jgi:tRNA A22 N-methylase
MTKARELRHWLTDNGFAFTEERLVWDKDFLYPIMAVTGGKQSPLTEIQYEYGVMLQGDPLYGDFLDQQIGRLQRVADSKRRARSEDILREAAQLDGMCDELRRMRKEWEQ